MSWAPRLQLRLMHVRDPQAARVQNSGSKTVLIAYQSHKQVLGTDMRVAQTLGLFSRIRQYPPALIGKGQVNRG